MLTIKTIINPPVRFAFTILGIALCAMLMLFLMAIYRGASEGSLSYVRESDADLWILQQHSSNILRSSSLLPASYGPSLQKIEGIESVSPVFFIMVSLSTVKGPATVYLACYDIQSGIGGPPFIAKGTEVKKNDEIVLDKSFASKYKISIGDSLLIKDDTLKVAGLSTGTNMFVIQYAFISLQKAHSIIGYPYFVSGFLVKLRPGTDSSIAIKNIRDKYTNIAVFDRKTFLDNNRHEMESGILPLLYSVAIIGAIVATAILSLILSMHVLERRNEYAIMKALGAPAGFLPSTILKQALTLSLCGMLTAIVFFFPMLSLVEEFSPEVTCESSIWQFITVIAGIGLICLISSAMPIWKLYKIYPLEIFK
jgi:putative ABC transport system permease protein